MYRSIKYELKPNSTQQQMLSKTFGCTRFIYNWGLNKKIEVYQKDKTTLSYYELSKQLTLLKKTQEYEWLKEVGAQQLQCSLVNLENAFLRFFKSKKGYPNFKCKNDKQSFKLPSPVKINYNNFKFFIPKIGWVKFYKDKIIEGNLKFATVTKTTTGRYFVSVTYEPFSVRPTGIGAVGIDLGIKTFAVSSENEVFENQKYLRSNLKLLKVEQRKLSRKYKSTQIKQSNNYYRQRLKISKLHEKIANQREDFLHKVSTYLSTTYHTVCIEDLSILNMVKNHKLALSILDCGWGRFKQMLEYKVADLRIIGRFEPSSQICNVCGDRNKELKLSQRTWVCSNNHKLDRDLNAAMNIRDIGLRVSTFDAKVG